MSTQYESVIGLEVHVQIKTESKLFCSCPTTFGADPNTNVCPICCGYPGVLPVLNRKTVESLVKTGIALGCEINLKSQFARKQYFYPDLPKNYQISQFEKPLAEHGQLILSKSEPGKKIGITRIHLEEDAGKLLHTVGSVSLDYSLVDLNRTGIALMEIVSEPDMRSAAQAQDYLTSLKMTLQYLGVSDCDMEKGSLRCDANISIRPVGQKEFGTKVEIKNMNSFKGVGDAIDFEIGRQIECVQSGVKIVQETRLWDAEKKESRSMRSKEQAHDYRYFPDPDLVAIQLEQKQLDDWKASLPELPLAKKERLIKEYGLSEYDATVLIGDLELSAFFESACAVNKNNDPKLICNWVTSDLQGRLKAENLTPQLSPISAQNISELVGLISDSTISSKIAKTVFEKIWNNGKSPKQVVAEENLAQVSDNSAIENWVKESIDKNPKAAEEFKSGKDKAIGALVGYVMRLSQGQANPDLVNSLLRKHCGRE